LNIPIKNAFSSQKINEISNELETKRKQIEQEIETFQPALEISEVDKSLYI